MKTYKFPQFKIEIINPIVTVDLNTISDKAVDKLLSVDVTLATDTATFGVRAIDMPYTDTWDDDDVEALVDNWLINYEV
jgi:hypothetical protein